MGRTLKVIILLIAVFGTSIVYAADGDNVRLVVGRSTVLDTGSPIARVSLTSADIADAMVTSANELLINGKAPGTISMFVWDRAGAIRRYEVIVQRDLARLGEQLQQLFPGESITAQSNGKAIVLSGTVTAKEVIERAVNVAAGYVEKKEDVVALLQIQPGATSQVLLRVRFAEVSRSAMTELGSSFALNGFKDGRWFARSTTQQFAAPEWDKDGKFVFSDFLNLFLYDSKKGIAGVVKALQEKGLFQSLAEPNLVAESGKEASFLAGGEIPIPIAQPSAGGATTVTVQFKEFGIRLNFTPVVIGNRVHLKVKPEVSTLDYSNGVVLQGFRIPGLSTRRTETELELMDGQTFAIAGLMNNTMNTTLSKIPGIGDIPILGLLFKSKAAQKNQTELVVMITPHILPRNSPGVTPNLPKIQEPYLAPLPTKKGLETPPPAFGAGPTGVAIAAPAAQPTTDTNASAAAAKLRGLTPSRPTTYVPPAAELPAKQTVGAVTATSSTPARQGAAQPAKKMSRRDQIIAEEAAARQQTKQAEIDRRNAKIEQERQAKAGKEQARRDVEQAKKDAEAARVAAIEAKKQAEIDRLRQKDVDEAAAKVKAAEAKYQELLKQKTSRQ